MKKVLVVDDGAFMRILIKGILTKNGYEVIGEASDGIDALEKYVQLNPDIVTLDITMPNMDGLTTLKEIIKIDGNARVIMVSAMGQDKNIKDAIINGAKSFIVKPFDESTFLAVLENICE